MGFEAYMPGVFREINYPRVFPVYLLLLYYINILIYYYINTLFTTLIHHCHT